MSVPERSIPLSAQTLCASVGKALVFHATWAPTRPTSVLTAQAIKECRLPNDRFDLQSTGVRSSLVAFDRSLLLR
jgi:hypothetical protein